MHFTADPKLLNKSQLQIPCLSNIINSIPFHGLRRFHPEVQLAPCKNHQMIVVHRRFSQPLNASQEIDRVAWKFDLLVPCWSDKPLFLCHWELCQANI